MITYISKAFLILIVFAFSNKTLFAQQQKEAKETVGIMPFTSKCSNCEIAGVGLQQLIVELFANKSHLIILDRSTDSSLISELKGQQQGEGINSDFLVEQGKKYGAKYIVVGVVTGLPIKETKEVTLSENEIPKKNGDTKYSVELNFSLQITNVETGQIIASKFFSSKKSRLEEILNPFKKKYSTVTEAISNVIYDNKQKINKQTNQWINKTYPPSIKFFSIESRDKNGFPETLLVSGISDNSLKKGTKLIVKKFQTFQSDGKTIISRKEIGRLKIKEFRGDLTLCSVRKGKELIEALINDNQIEIVLK